MIEKLNELLAGSFENKRQAFANPSKYAMIMVTHVPIFGEPGWFYGEQAYTYQLNKPYRQFVLKTQIAENKDYEVLNYAIEGKEQFAGAKNLDNLDKSMLRLQDGCTVKLHWSGAGFIGGLTGCDCHVTWNGRETYLQNEIELDADFYYVKDLGFDINQGHQIWGSKHGRFEFKRMPL